MSKKDEVNKNILLRSGYVYCKNCFRVSHCGNALHLALYPEKLPSLSLTKCIQMNYITMGI